MNATGTLLAYQLSTEPYPLVAGASAPAVLTVGVACPSATGECTVSQLQISLPVGDDPTDLTASGPPAPAVTSSDGAAWTVDAGTSAGSFTFRPPDGSVTIANQTLTIEMSGIELSPLVGTATIEVAEWATAGTASAPPATSAPSATTTLTVAKFPPGFYARDFITTTPQIRSGDTATLIWAGSDNATYTISYDDVTEQVSGGSWTSPALDESTTFVLTASASGADGQPVQLTLSTTVNVSGTLLNYSLTTYPSQVTVGGQVGLVLDVSCPSADASYTVGQIVVIIPVDDGPPFDPSSLTSTAPTESDASTTASGWQAILAPGAAGIFVFAPQTGSATLTDQSLALEINRIHVNPLVGTAEVKVIEWAVEGTGPPPPPTDSPSGRTTFSVAKYPERFSVNNFAASEPDVGIGETVRLTWEGSDNAMFAISYGDASGGVATVPVSGWEWTSPPLLGTTAFQLIASASEAGQTVSQTLGTTVTVNGPKVNSFTADQTTIDAGDTVTLSWETAYADGVCLVIGPNETKRIPGANGSYQLQPQYGVYYQLYAYKGAHTSGLSEVNFTFNPINFVTFAADPQTVTQDHPTTQLSWKVLNATAVVLHTEPEQGPGQPVDPTGSMTLSPTTPSTEYVLTATWLDNRTQASTGTSVFAAIVNVERCTVDVWGFDEPSNDGMVTLTFQASNADNIEVLNATLLCAEKTDWNAGQHFQRALPNGVGVQDDGPDVWNVYITDTAPFPNGPWNNVCVVFDYIAAGWHQQFVRNYVAVFRGDIVFPPNFP